MADRLTTDTIIVHCSATPQNMDIGVEEIRRWHTDPKPRGKGWSDIGYHYVIRRSGVVEAGRDWKRMGAHARGHNRTSIGICLVGGNDAEDRRRAEANYTRQQYRSLEKLIAEQYVLTGFSIKHVQIGRASCRERV